MKIEIIDFTENPLTMMGESARRCWGTPKGREVKIAKGCIESGHGRVSEFADIVIELSECSARVMREIYTHIAGTSRLQESTRYVDMTKFKYIIPPKIEKNSQARAIYIEAIENLQYAMKGLKDLGIPKEDYANLCPLGSHSKMVLKINVRALLHMAEQRMCTRAYWEFRQFMQLLKDAIAQINEEWEYVANLLKPKCEQMGYCTEEHCCGRYPKKDEVLDYGE